MQLMMGIEDMGLGSPNLRSQSSRFSRDDGRCTLTSDHALSEGVPATATLSIDGGGRSKIGG